MNKLFLTLILFLSMISSASAGFRFDALDDIANCGTSDSILLYNQAFTVSAWISPDTVGENTGGRIIEKASGTTRGLEINTASTKALRILIFGSTNMTRLSSNNVLTTGAWQHIVLTGDGGTTASNYHIYVNGVETGYQTTTNGVTLTSNAGDGIHIGNDSGAVRTFDGSIDEIAYWDVVLSAQEISNLANSKIKRMPLQINPSHLKGYWALTTNVNAGSSVDGKVYHDLSGNGNDCTADNGANNTGMTGSSNVILTYL